MNSDPNRKQRHVWTRRREAEDGGFHLRFLLCMSLREEGGEGAGERRGGCGPGQWVSL